MYTFKLQAVLDHRQFTEDNLKRELTELRAQKMTAINKLEVLNRKEKNTAVDLKQEQAVGITSEQVVAYHDYFRRLSQRITSQKSAVFRLEKMESEKKEELLEAMKKRQILEKVKEQEGDRYHQMMLKKEMDFIDEIAVNQFARKTLESNGGGE